MGAMILAMILVVVSLGAAGGLVVVLLREWEKATEKSNKVLVDAVGELARVIGQANSEATKAALEAWMSASVGKAGEAVIQPEVPKDGNITDPIWMTWDEGTDDLVPGVGDSVAFQRVFSGDERVATLDDGEPIIPGVPLPDMTGEKFDA